MNEPNKAPGRKDDTGKIRADLLPAGALMEVAKVLTFGAIKYQAENTWQNVTPFRSRYLAALMRHLFARMRGEIYDPESGLLHMAHLACCALFLLSWEVGHDGEERLPAPPRTPSAVGKVVSLGSVVRVATTVDGEAPSVVAPTTPAPRHMTSIPVTCTNPDADPDPSAPSYLVEADPFPAAPSTQRSSGNGTVFIQPEHVVIPKDYHILHMRSGVLVEEIRAEDAVQAFQAVQAFEAFAKVSDVVSVIKLGAMIFSKEVA